MSFKSFKSALGKFFLLVLSIASAIILIIVVFAVWGHIAFDKDRRNTTPAVIKQRKPEPAVIQRDKSVTPRSEANLVYSLRNPEKFGSFMIVRLGVGRSEKFSGLSSGYSGSVYGTANYLFIDETAQQSHWLWPDVHAFVGAEYPIIRPAANAGEKSEKTGFIISYAEKDTNDDAKVDGDDRQTLGIISRDGTKVTNLVPDVDRINSITASGDNKMLLMYEKAGKAYASFYDVTEEKVTGEVEIPSLTLP